MMNTTKILLFAILLLASNTQYASASTYINPGDIDHGASWDKSGSPYILNDNIYVQSGYLLNVDKGVTIMSASNTEPYTLTIDGDLRIVGDDNEPVVLDNLGQIYLSNSNVDIDNAIFNNTGIQLWQSSTTIINTTIRNTDKGIIVKGSRLNASKLNLINNRIGIASYPILEHPYLMLLGIRTVHAETSNLDINHNIIRINDSNIYNNSEYGVMNYADNYIEARDVWWGSINGPRLNSGDGDRISGRIDYDPWKKQDINPIPKCCSSVIFLPGIEASRLYKDKVTTSGTSTNTLWEPNRNQDVIKLYLSDTGQSMDSAIYTKDIIDLAFSNALGVEKIYKSFITMMNGVVADGKIKSWIPFPYDWRMSVSDIVYGKTKLSTTSISLIDTLVKLSSDSLTGKVTLIAHSNGGLVAKQLVKVLNEMGKGEIIDKVITIGTPDLGAPQAIPAILHGYKQSILAGFVLFENVARNLSKNSLGALGLLPSRSFFDRASTSVIVDEYSATPKKINTYDKLFDFLTNNNFSTTNTSNVDIPILLSKALLRKVESVHSSLDEWKFPTSTNLMSFVGWGMPTTQAIKYEKDRHCRQRNSSQCELSYSAIVNNYGDGTVSTNSTSQISSSTIYINLKNINSDHDKAYEHYNILESNTVLSVIKEQVEDNGSSINNERYFSSTEPVDNSRWLTIKLHSPIDIHVYDTLGRHTGVINDPKRIGVLDYEKNIPSSFYANFGKIKMLRVPFDQEYEMVLEGSGNGKFTLDAEVTQGNRIIATTTFEEIPVTQSLNALLILSSSTNSFNDDSSLLLDKDGDGITESIISNKASNLEVVKKKINRITNKGRKNSRYNTIDAPRRF